MQKTLAEIAKFIDGELIGDGNLMITGLCGIKEAKKGDITFVANPKYFSLIEKTKASAIIAPREGIRTSKPVIRTTNPSLAFAKMATLMVGNEKPYVQGIHRTAIIADDAAIGKNISVGPYTIIESKTKINKS